MKNVPKLLLILCVLFGGLFKANSQVTLQINKPLSMEDKKRVDVLLKDFDPNTYKLSTSYVDESGSRKKMATGDAVGLGNVKMSNTTVRGAGTRASTVNTNNIFKASTLNTNNIFMASTTNTINIFKASTVNTNNIFKPSDAQLSKMNELHQILS